MKQPPTTKPSLFWAFGLAEFLGVDLPETDDAMALLTEGIAGSDADADAIWDAFRFLSELDDAISADPRQTGEWVGKFFTPSLWFIVLLAMGTSKTGTPKARIH